LDSTLSANALSNDGDTLPYDLDKTDRNDIGAGAGVGVGANTDTEHVSGAKDFILPIARAYDGL